MIDVIIVFSIAMFVLIGLSWAFNELYNASFKDLKGKYLDLLDYQEEMDRKIDKIILEQGAVSFDRAVAIASTPATGTSAPKRKGTKVTVRTTSKKVRK